MTEIAPVEISLQWRKKSQEAKRKLSLNEGKEEAADYQKISERMRL